MSVLNFLGVWCKEVYMPFRGGNDFCFPMWHELGSLDDVWYSSEVNFYLLKYKLKLCIWTKSFFVFGLFCPAVLHDIAAKVKLPKLNSSQVQSHLHHLLTVWLWAKDLVLQILSSLINKIGTIPTSLHFKWNFPHFWVFFIIIFKLSSWSLIL